MIYLPEIENIYLGTSGVTKIMQAGEIVWPVVPYDERYLTFQAYSTGTVEFKQENGLAPLLSIEYSLNNGAWTAYSGTFSINAYGKVQFRGLNPSYEGHILCINGADYRVYGNVMSLIYGDNFTGKTALTESKALSGIFERHTTNQGYLLHAGNLVLPATTLTSQCYESMFLGQTNMASAPVLTSASVPFYAYNYMFAGCQKLTSLTCLLETPMTQKTMNWLDNAGVSNAVFYKHPNATWERGISGVPNFWTIRDAEL